MERILVVHSFKRVLKDLSKMLLLIDDAKNLNC